MSTSVGGGGPREAAGGGGRQGELVQDSQRKSRKLGFSCRRRVFVLLSGHRSCTRGDWVSRGALESSRWLGFSHHRHWDFHLAVGFLDWKSMSDLRVWRIWACGSAVGSKHIFVGDARRHDDGRALHHYQPATMTIADDGEKGIGRVGYRTNLTYTTRTRPSITDYRSDFDRYYVGRWWWPSVRSESRSEMGAGRKPDSSVHP